MNTPRLYSIVPIAPSKTTIESGSRRRSIVVTRSASHRVVLRLRMMHDDRRRALLGDQLEGARQFHTELAFRRQNLEQLRVVLEVRAGPVTPRVAFALSRRHPELVTRATVHPLGDRLRRLDGEPVG